MEEKGLALSLLDKFHEDREKILRYSAIAEMCPIPAYVTGSDGTTVLYVNPAFIELTGMTLSELQNGNWINAVHPDDRADAMTAWTLFTKSRQSAAHQHRYIHKNGTVTAAMRIANCVENNGFVGFIVPQCGEPNCPVRRLNRNAWNLAAILDARIHQVVPAPGLPPGT